MYIKLLSTGACANINIREIMLISIISSASWTLQPRGRNGSVGRMSDWKARRNTDAGSSPRCGKYCFPWSQDQRRLSYGAIQPHAQQHASTSAPTLKLTSTGSHIALFGHRKILNTLMVISSVAYHIALFGHRKILNTLIVISSVAYAAAVSY